METYIRHWVAEYRLMAFFELLGCDVGGTNIL